MPTPPTLASILALGMFGLCAFAGRPAAAEGECAKDSDCVKGWTCELSSSAGCAYACAPGEDCPPPADCQMEQSKSCRPGPCKADSDCASGMVCYSQTETSCPPSACDSGGECPKVACTTETKSACVPRYLLPCKVASDCGAGFSCAETKSNCACSGSAPSSGGSGDSPTPDPAPDCTCDAGTTSICVAVPVDCKTASDCAAGWSCEEMGSSVDCATEIAPAPSGGAGGAPPAPVVDPCPPAPARVKQCAPPYYREVGSASDDSSLPQGESNPGSAKPTTANQDSGADSTSSAGCSVAFGSHAGGAGALLFALGLLGVSRRRRASAAR